MSIQRAASGFLEWHDPLVVPPSLGIESDRLDECVAYYHQAGFRGLFGNPTFGFRESNLNFLKRTTNAVRLWFWDVELRDIDAVYSLADLEYFGIHPKRPGIDFSRFPRLRTVVNHWLTADTGLNESTITTYYLWHFKPKSKSFENLEIPTAVRELQFCWANPVSLQGLPTLPNLQMLQFHRCRNLVDLSLLPQIAPNLKRLLITTSSRVEATAGVLDHPSLQSALISGQEMLPCN